MDEVVLEGTVKGIIGILDFEKIKPQTVNYEIKTSLDLKASAVEGDLSKSINYAEIQNMVEFLIRHGRIPLLESVAWCICQWLLAPPGPAEGRCVISDVEVRLSKPEILTNALPTIVMRRRAGVVDLQTPAPGVSVQTLVSLPTGSVFRLTVDEGASYQPRASLHLLPAIAKQGVITGPATVMMVGI